jgi:hypothetical protein
MKKETTKISLVLKQILPDTLFNTLLHNNEQRLEQIIATKTTIVYPVTIIYTIDSLVTNTPHIRPILLHEEIDFATEKYNILYQIGYAEGRKGNIIIAIFFCCEAWMKIFDKESDHTKQSLSEYEDKQEVISLSGLTVDRRANGTTYFIARRKDQTIIQTDKETKEYSSTGPQIENNLLVEFYKGYTDGIGDSIKQTENTQKFSLSEIPIEKIFKKSKTIH